MFKLCAMVKRGPRRKTKMTDNIKYCALCPQDKVTAHFPKHLYLIFLAQRSDMLILCKFLRSWRMEWTHSPVFQSPSASDKWIVLARRLLDFETACCFLVALNWLSLFVVESRMSFAADFIKATHKKNNLCCRWC